VDDIRTVDILYSTYQVTTAYRYVAPAPSSHRNTGSSSRPYQLFIVLFIAPHEQYTATVNQCLSLSVCACGGECLPVYSRLCKVFVTSY